MKNYVLKNRLNDNKKDIIKDASIFAVGSVVAVAGVFGVIYFGKELVDFYQSEQTLTFASRFAADWEEAKIGFSMIPVIVGGKVAFNGGRMLKEDVSYRKVLKKEYDGDKRVK